MESVESPMSVSGGRDERRGGANEYLRDCCCSRSSVVVCMTQMGTVATRKFVDYHKANIFL